METIISQLEKSFNETTQLLSEFNQEEINTIPFKDSWTAAQVGCHLLKSGTDNILTESTHPVDGAPDENIENLKKLFLNFENKMQAPDFIIPEDKIYNKQELITSLKELSRKTIEAAHKSNLSQTTSLPDIHPLKEMSKLEMIHFLTYHTMRHNNQIRNIRASLNV
ncbi:DinB family protein [Flavobacterium sp. C4GT6]|uniref:DinB family protein n=1 Tax=Flavobacterium sp. C4GT6 TaxID=3103818 RepID=UPI002ED5B60B